MKIIPVTATSDYAAIGQLFAHYVTWLGIDLAFQNCAHELATLPDYHGSARAALFLAWMDGSPAGCIGLRPFSASVGQVEQLYVVPAFRGRSLALQLVASVVTAAKQFCYEELVLDTLPSMQTAIAVYKSFGFEPTETYYPNPIAEALYFRTTLAPKANT